MAYVGEYPPPPRAKNNTYPILAVSSSWEQKVIFSIVGFTFVYNSFPSER